MKNCVKVSYKGGIIYLTSKHEPEDWNVVKNSITDFQLLSSKSGISLYPKFYRTIVAYGDDSTVVEYYVVRE